MKTAITDTSTVSALLSIAGQNAFPVVNNETNEYMGYIAKESIRRAEADLQDMSAGEFLARTDMAGVTRSIYVLPDEPADEAIEKLAQYNVDVLPIVDADGKFDGIVDYPSLRLVLDKKD